MSQGFLPNSLIGRSLDRDRVTGTEKNDTQLLGFPFARFSQ